VGDFSFSFNQTDLALAIVYWIGADMLGRHQHLRDLAEFYCVHQITAKAKEALQALAKKAEEFCALHGQHLIPDATVAGSCRGTWCPQRKVILATVLAL